MTGSGFWSIGMVAAVLVVASPALAVVDVVTVPVGNPGNADDATGYGGVGYTYNIGKFEVTAGEYTDFLNAVAATDTYGLYYLSMWAAGTGCKIQQSGSSGSYTYSVGQDWADRPVNWVSWGDAARFCNWLENGQPTGEQDLTTTEDGSYYLNGATSNDALIAVTRKEGATWVIPSEDEWYKAAYHKNDGVTGNYFDYPTSSDAVPSNDLVDPDPGNNATFKDSDDPGWTIGDPYYRTEVGAHENSGSPYGTYDQGGNVWEWNEAIVWNVYGLLRGYRGGSYYGFSSDLRASGRSAYYPTGEFNTVGFRVVSVPEPATLALLAFGGVGMLVRRKAVSGDKGSSRERVGDMQGKGAGVRMRGSMLTAVGVVCVATTAAMAFPTGYTLDIYEGEMTFEVDVCYEGDSDQAIGISPVTGFFHMTVDQIGPEIQLLDPFWLDDAYIYTTEAMHGSLYGVSGAVLAGSGFIGFSPSGPGEIGLGHWGEEWVGANAAFLGIDEDDTTYELEGWIYNDEDPVMVWFNNIDDNVLDVTLLGRWHWAAGLGEDLSIDVYIDMTVKGIVPEPTSSGLGVLAMGMGAGCSWIRRRRWNPPPPFLKPHGAQ